ncbi:staygreen family protein [Halalkalibacter krulwichiae]|uniref:Staygreen protein n=1 Tax=Halalkalibacter krulwichiae TaxID=199441 RepID=A0A1X9M7U9_9BACI|nr:staygreen family protein [Halalkalibacter krulwichiae]ARK29498.1 Staygreen protein [Halalkalibacter krulwichiae]
MDIGFIVNCKAIDWELRDEVIVELQVDRLNRPRYVGVAYIDEGEFTKEQSQFRYSIFQKEMSTALKGIFYGDQPFFANYPTLLNAPIYIMYKSIYPEFQRIIYYGTPIKYLKLIQYST